MIARFIRGATVLGALLFLAGCYETDAPVIEAGDGDEIPDFAGIYISGDKGDVVIEDRTEGLVFKDYKYSMQTSEGAEYEILAAELADQLWHLQLARTQDDGSTSYLHIFLGREDDLYGFKIPETMDENKTAEKVGRELGVTIEGDQITRGGKTEMRFLLTGSPDAIKDFLNAHADRIKLTTIMTLIRK